MGSGEPAAGLESFDNFRTVGQVGHVIAAFAVSLQRQNLAVDAKTTDLAVGTELQR